MYVSQSTKTTAGNRLNTGKLESNKVTTASNANNTTGSNRTADNSKSVNSNSRISNGNKGISGNSRTSINSKSANGSRRRRSTISTSLEKRSGKIVVERKYKATPKDVALFILSVCSLAGFAILVIYLAQVLSKFNH